MLGWFQNITKQSVKRYTVNTDSLKLEDFTEIRTVTDDCWNKRKNGNVNLEYFDKNGNSIGFIDYRIYVGQIGLFFITNNEYKKRGLGKQMLNKAIDEMRTHRVRQVWAVTTDNHTFWSNVWDKSFRPQCPSHKSVTGSGYVMDI